ncbi:MAG TPA: LacI family DNA-binding transcriptional regulator [Bryobacteraceae bacterium]|nr:LacI family DNA-binding transcriptional regulator [Bryobacteraceae bacterium]
MMATIREVAARARVSVGTVSNVLSGAVPVSKRLRERVLAVVQELDYQPNQLAQSLKSRQTKMIGMVIRDITHPLFAPMMRGAQDAAWLQNYLLVMLDSDRQLEREQQILAALRTRRVDGILLAATGIEQAHVRAICEAGIPVVCLERELPGLGIDCVIADHFEGARKCVAHLAACGNRSIAFLHGDTSDWIERERFGGYRQGLEDAGVEFDQSLQAGDHSGSDEGYRAAAALLDRRPRPAAILAADATVAAGLLRAVRDRGLRCPHDITIAAFDDPFSCDVLRPRITAVSQPSYHMGSKAMEILLKRIQDPDRRRSTVTLETELHVRESSACSAAGSGAA